MNKQGKNGIEWCDYTFNPVTGCLNGCEYCYARKIANRFKGYTTGSITNLQHHKEETKELHVLENNLWKTTKILKGKLDKAPYPFGFDPTFHKYRLDELQKVKKPGKIFVCSMGELFGDWVPYKWITKVFEACQKVPRHKYLFLTKNPEKYREAFPLWQCYYNKLNNMWLGTTITQDNAENITRAWSLLKLPDKINTFISIEPIQGFIDLNKYELLLKDWRKIFTIGKYLDWVIVGAETGNRKDKVFPKREWIESIVEQCRNNNVPVFLKSNLKSIWGEDLIQEFPEGLKL